MTSDSAPPGSSRLGRWTGVLGVLISAALLWWVLHDVDIGEVAGRIAGADPFWLAAMIVTATLTFPLRTIRWRYLLRLEGEPLPFRPLWHATAIGFMANNILPARAGEFARAYAARHLTGARFTTAFASIAVERLLDGVTVIILLLVGVFAGGFGAGTTVGGISVGRIAFGAGLVFGAVLAIMLVVVRRPTTMLGLARRMLSAILPARWTDRVTGVLEGLVAGMDALGAPSRAAAAVVWSFVIWGTAVLSFECAFRAFGLDVPWNAGLVLQALIALGVAVPSAPGFFGVFEGVARATLALYAVPAGLAVSLAVGYHVLTFLPITLLGLISLGLAGMRLGDLQSSSSS